MILRCTKKLLDVIRPQHLKDRDPDPEDWYANLLFFDRRKCLLLTHTETLFTVFDRDVRTADLRSTHKLVTQLIERELLAEGFPLSTFGNLQAEGLTLTKTADRRFLGCMNDMAVMCVYAIGNVGNLERLDLRSLNRQLHRYINSSRNYERPIDMLTGRITPRCDRRPDIGTPQHW